MKLEKGDPVTVPRGRTKMRTKLATVGYTGAPAQSLCGRGLRPQGSEERKGWRCHQIQEPKPCMAPKEREWKWPVDFPVMDSRPCIF